MSILFEKLSMLGINSSRPHFEFFFFLEDRVWNFMQNVRSYFLKKKKRKKKENTVSSAEFVPESADGY